MHDDIKIPENFPYRDILFLGRPLHDKYDPFLIEHPPMPASRWAKIYAPFDALRGFQEAIASKQVLYENRHEPDVDGYAELDQQIRLLKTLVPGPGAARQNRVKVSITYYKPCQDIDSAAYGSMGTYKTITGICWNVDTDESDMIRVGQEDIRIRDIRNIEISNP